jgi:hypothetical protein
LEHGVFVSADAQRWTGRAYDALASLVSEGEQVLPGHDRPDKKVRKRKPSTIKL